MESYVKPTLNKSPTKIIMYAGTNDFKSRKNHEIADSLVDLAYTTESSSDAEVIPSEVVTRRDAYCQAAKDVNKRLRRACFCSQNGWGLVSHTTIDQVWTKQRRSASIPSRKPSHV